MGIQQIVQLNDWPLRRFVVTIASFQVATVGAVAGTIIVPAFAPVRAVLGFLYLLFVPGIVLLRAIGVHRIGALPTLLFASGLSLSLLMLLGFIMNITYPVLGVIAPISLGPLVGTLGMIVVGLTLLTCVTEKNFVPGEKGHDRLRITPQTLALVLLPLIAILGAAVLNTWHSNIGQAITIGLIGTTIFLACVNRFYDESYYAPVLFSVSIALLFHASFVSNHLVEWADLSFEYRTSSIVLQNSAWNAETYGNLNAMLSIVILPPSFSLFTGLDLTWVYKLVCPVIYALVPVGLFRAYKDPLGAKRAFLASSFFVAVFSFYTVMLGAVRQEFAELFVVLIIILLAGKPVGGVSRSAMMCLFGVSMVVSHYALSYLYLMALVVAWCVSRLARPFESDVSLPPENRGHGKFAPDRRDARRTRNLGAGTMIPTTFIVLVGVCSLAWYTYVSGASILEDAVRIGKLIADNVYGDFLNPKSSQGLELILQRPASLFNYAYRGIYLLFQGFIVVGFFATFLRKIKTNLPSAYIAMSVPFLGMAAAGIIVPYFALSINATRLFPITLLYLAPFTVVGSHYLVASAGRILRRPRQSQDMKREAALFVVSLLVFFLFNSGLLHQLARQPVSFALDPTGAPRPNFNDEEFVAANWISSEAGANQPIYADAFGAYLVEMTSGQFLPLQGSTQVTSHIGGGSYIFLGSENVNARLIRLDDPIFQRINVTQVQLSGLAFNSMLSSMNVIYDNGYARVYYFQP